MLPGIEEVERDEEGDVGEEVPGVEGGVIPFQVLGALDSEADKEEDKQRTGWGEEAGPFVFAIGGEEAAEEDVVPGGPGHVKHIAFPETAHFEPYGGETGKAKYQHSGGPVRGEPVMDALLVC